MTSTAAGPDQPGLAAARTTGASVVRGGVWNVAARALPQVYVLIISVAAARFLGPDGMGRQSFIAFVALSTTMFFAGGLSLAVMRFIGEELGRDRPGAAIALVRWAWRVAFVGAVLGAGILLAVALAGAEPQSAWALAGLAAGFGVLHTVPSALLIGTQRWRDATIAGLTTFTAGVPATIAVLAAGGGITGMFAVGAVTGFANLVLTWMLARRAMRRLGASPQRVRSVERATARFAAWSSVGVLLTFIIFRRSEFFFLNHYSADSQIALYSIPFAAIYGLTLLFEAASGVVVPAFATLKGAGAMDRIRSGYERSLRLVTLASLPVAAGVLTLGPETLRLIYGGEYSGTSPVLRLLAISLPFVPLMQMGTGLLTGLGLVRPGLVAGAVAAVLNVALAFALIPAHDATGAALANTGAQVTISMAVFAYTWKLIGASPIDLDAVARPAIASALVAASAWAILSELAGVPGVVLGTAVGIAVFGLVGRLLRVLRDDDAQWLWAASGERALGRVVRPACRVLAGAAASEGRT